MIDVYLKGMAVGIAVAAPVGPIGLLCIKRTLAGGWGMGLTTGLGIASADASYGMMVAAGFAVTGLLVSFAGPMQLGGGLLIALLGLLSLRQFLRGHGADRPARGSPVRSHAGAFFSAFALTLSNPMTILAFIGLIAGLGTAAAAQPGAAYVLVAGVFTGSALWFVVLTSAASLARRRLKPSVTRWLDLVSGAILLVWGTWLAAEALPA